MTEIKELTSEQQFLEKVAHTIGGDVTADRIANFLKLVSQKGLLFHGIKSRQSAKLAFKQGILPLTPEGGKVSFWSFGPYIFAHPITLEKGMFGIDSPFFDYAHWNDAQTSGFTIAITERDKLSGGYKEGLGQTQITVPINPSLIQFIHIEGENTSLEPRRFGQAMEQKAFSLMERSVIDGPAFGTVIRGKI